MPNICITPLLLELQHLTIARGEHMLCNDVSLTLHAGEICHLQGTNGSGKTTLLMQLAGLLPLQTAWMCSAQRGVVRYLGQVGLPIQPIYVAHQTSIESRLTVVQNLTFLLNLYGICPTKNELQHALAWVGLQDWQHVRCGELSAGQRQRVNLARLALMHPKQTPLWLLDEPLTALDAQMRARLEQRLHAFAQIGGAVLLTSHQPLAVVTKTVALTCQGDGVAMDADHA